MKSCVRTLTIGALLCVVLSTGCSPGWTASSARYRTARVEKYRKPIDTETLQPGEKIQVLLHTSEQQMIPATIDEHGCITLPLIGSVKIGWLAPAKAEDVIKQEYVRKKFYKESAIQIGIQTSEKTCYVDGHVRRPGACQFSRPITINMAISNAGGRDEFADDRAVELTRGGKKQDLDGKKDGDIVMVEPGDIIRVPRGRW